MDGVDDLMPRPSSMKRDARCPGARRFCAYILRRFGSAPVLKETDTGTRCHDVMRATMHHATREWSMERGSYPREYVLPLLSAEAFAQQYVERYHSCLSSYDVWAIGEALHAIYDLLEQYGARPADIHLETHLRGQADLGLDPQHGTADVVLVLDDLVVTADYKFGYLWQDGAEDNDQMAVYGVLSHKSYAKDTSHVSVIQPRQRDCSVTKASFDLQALEQTAEWIAAVTERCNDPHAEPCASYDACYYCDGSPWCAPCWEWIMQAQQLIDQMDATPDADVIAEVIARCKVAAKLPKKADPIAKEYMAKEEVPGWGLGKPRRRIKVTDASALRGLAEAHGLLEVYHDCCTPSGAKLEDAVGEETFVEVFGAAVEITTDSPAIVRRK